MIDIKEDQLLWCINFLIKSQQGVALLIIIITIMRLNKICNQLKNCTNQLLKNFKKRKVYSGFKDNIWGADLADLDSYCVFFIFSVNMFGLFLYGKENIKTKNYIDEELKSESDSDNDIDIDIDNEE